VLLISESSKDKTAHKLKVHFSKKNKSRFNDKKHTKKKFVQRYNYVVAMSPKPLQLPGVCLKFEFQEDAKYLPVM